MTLRDFAARVAQGLVPTAHGVRIAGDLDGTVERVAVVGGAGDSLFDEVRAAGADVYVTADLRHHPALEAREEAEFSGGGKPYLVDVSHSASEWAWLQRAAKVLSEELSAGQSRVECVVLDQVADPWTARMGGDWA
jgi:putative NIF3 family GTP cyclohydrolase 1 type 2